jgi:large subunit ribosomal protein L1
MATHGKQYLASREKVDPQLTYSPGESISLVKQLSYAKFDETVELHMRMGVDPRHADQQVRGVASLPSGTGNVVRIMVFAEGESARLAEEAGADYVGTDEYAEKIQEGWMDFDIAIAIPQVMGKIGRLGRYLGRRGLMPNPKAGTIVQPDDIPDAIKAAREGRVEFRVDRTSNLHVPIGKVSFTEEQLYANLRAVVGAILGARPSGAKGQYIRKITMASTMGPGIKLDVAQAEAMTEAA